MTHKIYKRVVLVILDGFGVASPSQGNAITLAGMPKLDKLISQYPATTLQASGTLVGLPFGEPGNSEVGHLSIGAGRIVGQDMPRITREIESGQFFQNPAFLKACEHVKNYNSRLHLVGLVSPGGVHSLDEHLYALLGLADQQGIGDVAVHFFTDGRDAPPQGGLDAMRKLQAKIRTIGVGRLATVMGRFYAMDRGGHWEQTKMALDCILHGQGQPASDPEEAIVSAYQSGINDELIRPTVIVAKDAAGQDIPVGQVRENDAVIFFNFRQDRMVQISTALSATHKTPLGGRLEVPANLCIVTMTEYAAGLPVEIAYPFINIRNHLAEVLARAGLKQLHTAETEKYAHVTSFFNCGNLDVLPGEERVIVESPNDNSQSYANVPEMSARKLTEALVRDIAATDINFFVVNFANADMVGHTGNLPAAVRAVSVLDECIEIIAKACLERDAVMILTADHGNIEQMLDLKNGTPDTDHTSNPVPLVLIANELRRTEPLKRGYNELAAIVPVGMIADVAPTVLELFGLKVPEEMRSVSLFKMIE